MEKNTYILDFRQINLEMIHQVGGKNASLGEMIRNLDQRGIKVPGGFAITVDAYNAYIKHNELKEKIDEAVSGLDTSDIAQLRKTGAHVRQLITEGEFPEDLKRAISIHYLELSEGYGQAMTDVAVRSSATAEDLPDASFAGQQETFLNVRGFQMLLNSVKNCFASLFTDRAISYRASRGYDHLQVKLSVGVQKMVRSDLGVSGVAFSIDTESGFKDVVLINGTYGLGELVVQGEISPDEFLVFKPSLKAGKSLPIIEKKLGKKDHKLIYGTSGGELVKRVAVDEQMRQQFCMTDEQIIQLGQWVCEIEDYYTKKKGHWSPMDVEWAIDGLTGELFIVQARPETIHSQKNDEKAIEYHLEGKSEELEILVEGIAVGDKIGAGKVKRLFSLEAGGQDEVDFKEGDILVTEMTDPDWEPLMKKAAAIITNKGGRTCHAAIVARELGVPAIVGTVDATERIKDGEEVTVSCAEGDVGKVYNGIVPFRRDEIRFADLPTVSTPIMMNVASPELAFKFSKIPNAGVGLAREEFIINNFIQAHPLALLNHRELGDEQLTQKIESLIEGYADEKDFFIQKLSYGIARIGAAFYPNKVIVRFSDFKSNEYRNLLGGKYFEPEEENPMIGWRGASRYYSEAYKPAFGLECQAIKKVRDEMGLDNVIVMVPFCRTPEEMERVLETMAEFGLVRGENGLEVYLMAELPSNILMAEEFCKYIDGFSIGSNDLTQLTLGLDRDSNLVAHLYDERSPAVKRLISQLIRTAKKNKVKVGICGQGPSDFPDFAEFLVREGIDTISVTPDSMLKTILTIHNVEEENNAKIKVKVA